MAACGVALALFTFVSMMSVVAFFQVFRSHPWYSVAPGSLFIGTVAAALAGRWIKKPRLLALRHGIELFGALINNVVVWAALFVVYVVGIGVTALFARLAGKKFLEMGIDHADESWWKPLNLSTESRERYFDMF